MINTDTSERVKHYLERTIGVSPEKFEELFPHPVLVVMGGVIDPESDFHTRVSLATDVVESMAKQVRFDPNARVFPVTKRTGANPYAQMIIIGRTANTDIQLQSSEISKMHALITWQDKPKGRTYKIADGKSRNGTWLNSKRLRPQRVHELTSGGVIKLGRTMLLRYLTPTHFYEALMKMHSR